MVGDDGGSNKIGVAAGARWIAAKGCEADLCTTAALLSSMEFMLAPTYLTGENTDPDKRPDIVNNSWGGPSPNTDFQQAVQHWIAAGMFPVFANGNEGPASGTAGSPGLFPEAYAVGNYTSVHVIANLSSRGPGPDPYNTIKPNISAPGTATRSAVPGGGYGLSSGTSMAAPHVAGAVALLWSGSSYLGDVEGTRDILDQTAIPVNDLTCGGEPEFNNVWGRGRLDAYAAVKAADTMGYLEGIINETSSGASLAAGDPVEGVTVTAVNEETGLGRRAIRFPPARRHLRCSVRKVRLYYRDRIGGRCTDG